MESSETPTEVDLGGGTTLGRLVVPLAHGHGFDRGMSLAARLAEHWGLPIHLVSTAAADDAERALEDQQSALLAAHPSVVATAEVVGREPTPAASLSSRLHDDDLVVMAAESATDEGWGDFAQALAHESGGPVVMIGPEAQIDATLHGDVVVGLDGSALAERGLAPAVGLAAALDSQVWAVQVVSSATTEEIERLRARGERVSESAYIRDALDRTDSPGASWEIVHGDDPALSLVELVRDRTAAFLVLTTHGQTALPRAAFGSVCWAAVQRCPRPVLVIRPARSEPAEG